MFRVQVTSIDGWVYFGAGWAPRVSWSTALILDSLEEARAEADALKKQNPKCRVRVVERE